MTYQKQKSFIALLPVVLSFNFLISLPKIALGIGETPANPINFPQSSTSLVLSFSADEEVWVRLPFTVATSRSHVQLVGSGDADEISVYSDLDAAQSDIPLDEDFSTSGDLEIQAPLGFETPYLVRLLSNSAGSTTLTKSFYFQDAQTCDWPAGCPFVVSARGEISGPRALALLRQVRRDILRPTVRGQQLIDLYWRLAPTLSRKLILDSNFRQEAFASIEALLPLGQEALQVVEGKGGRIRLTSADVDLMESWVERLKTLVPPDLGHELEKTWGDYALRDQAGQPLSEVLDAVGLSTGAVPYRILVKLRLEPISVPSDKNGRAQFKSGSDELDDLLRHADLESIRRIHRVTPKRQAVGLTRTLLFVIRGKDRALALIDELRLRPEVEWAHISKELRALGKDPFRDDLWGIDAIKAPQAWTETQGVCSTRVAIIDTGIRPDLTDFGNRVLMHLGYDFGDDDQDATDDHGHGTHVAGTVAATADNSTSVVGVAPNVCLIPIKVLDSSGSGNDESVAAGIVHAVDVGAHILNMSLGGAGDASDFPAIEEALEYAANNGVLAISAAGNDGAGVVGYPAGSTHSMAISAVDEALELASFSNYGVAVDLAAPGVDVVSTFIDGESCLGSGTSMAAPHAAGAAALVHSTDSSLSHSEIWNLLIGNARDLGDSGKDVYFGYGLVDAAAAVAEASQGSSGGTLPSCGENCLAFHQGRFEARVNWRSADGSTGKVGVVPAGTTDSRLGWFFDADNWEMLIKVLDGCSINQHVWVFAAATTDVEYLLEVKDTSTGETATYFNPLGQKPTAVTDSRALANSCGGSNVLSSNSLNSTRRPHQSKGASKNLEIPSKTCSGNKLCLQNSRFQVEAEWRNAAGQQGVAKTVSVGSDDSGMLWFFEENNWEMLIKVLDGCSINDRYWVFAAATTDVEYTLRVTDTQTGETAEYFNPLGQAPRAVADTGAFATCD